ncbi:MAG: sulfide/dihydroorotate dehydrogenase-like FAD/NAD-binding protein, partial [Clostridia bacterium]|nr:sulfide/dihydroorotate dehydrogenase-like FAD/NAD-binding protein [Clostridia bacterium]
MPYKIAEKRMLNPTVFLMEIEAPLVARKAEPGQFIILRIDENGERVPFTVADFDREKGTVTIIVQIVGKTTQDLSTLETGDYLLDFAGPLGQPTPLDGKKKVAVIGGGLGTAIAYPQAKKLHNLGADVTVIAGFRNKDLVILEDELKVIADKLIIATDDGSNGTQGFVTDMLEKEILA